MKLLNPILNRKSYIALLDRTILNFFKEIYTPIIALQKENVAFNALGALKEALLSGRVQFNNNNFTGRFNAKIVKDLQALGAKFDKRTGAYNLNISQVPFDVMNIIISANQKFRIAHEQILDYLNGIDENPLTSKLNEFDFEDDFFKIASSLENQFQTTTKSLNVGIEMTEGFKLKTSGDFANDLKRDIKKFTLEETARLREQVSANTFAGYRAENLVKFIKRSFSVSQNKAEFLARQESNLLTSLIRETRYKDAGISSYKWEIRGFKTREDHKKLDESIQHWDSPPVTNRATGARNHPGEDFNCFCVARPIVSF